MLHEDAHLNKSKSQLITATHWLQPPPPNFLFSNSKNTQTDNPTNKQTTKTR